MKVKYQILIVVGIVAIFLIRIRLIKSSHNEVIESLKQNIENQKKELEQKKDSIILVRDTIIKNLKSQNEKAKERSNYWYNQAKRNNVNPNYDIDFITAVDEITKSNYEPGGSNGNTRQEKGD